MDCQAVQERAKAAALAGSHGIEDPLKAYTVLVEDDVGSLTVHKFNESIDRRELLFKCAP
jgi:hypothetical protein